MTSILLTTVNETSRNQITWPQPSHIKMSIFISIFVERMIVLKFHQTFAFNAIFSFLFFDSVIALLYGQFNLSFFFVKVAVTEM